MKICDNCGCPTNAESDHASGIILCELCATGRRITTEEIIAGLERNGIDVDTFLRRIYAAVERVRVTTIANIPTCINNQPQSLTLGDDKT